MKGIIVTKGKEVTCNIEGESWKQGDKIQGTLTTSGLENQKVKLALGNVKKVKAKDINAFKILEEKICSDGENFSFQLSNDAPVTDKKDAYYLLFGDDQDILKMGALQLNIAPAILTQNFLKIFDTFFRFKVKEIKTASKGYIDIKLLPPVSKEFKLIDSLNLWIKLNEKDMNIIYKFKVHKIDYTDPALKMKKSDITFEANLAPKDYILFKDDLDQDKIITHLQSILDQTK